MVESDHKRIQTLMGKNVAEIHSLSVIKHGKDMYIADLVSRNYLKETAKDDKFEDMEIQKLIQFCIINKSKVPLEIEPYFHIRNGLYVLDDFFFVPIF